jgi:hypothetical protein
VTQKTGSSTTTSLTLVIRTATSGLDFGRTTVSYCIYPCLIYSCAAYRRQGLNRAVDRDYCSSTRTVWSVGWLDNMKCTFISYVYINSQCAVQVGSMALTCNSHNGQSMSQTQLQCRLHQPRPRLHQPQVQTLVRQASGSCTVTRVSSSAPQPAPTPTGTRPDRRVRVRVVRVVHWPPYTTTPRTGSSGRR